MTLTNYHSRSDLMQLSHRVHDLWLCVDDLTQLPQSGTLKITLYNTGNIPIAGDAVGTLLIFNVLSVDVNDTEKIGIYDINEITYSETEKLLKIVGCVPFEARIYIKSIELALELVP